MIGNSKIFDAITSGDISICYSFLPNSDGIFLRVENNIVAASEENPIAFKYLKSKVVRNRICLTTGPLLLPITNGAVSFKHNFKSIPGIVDLRKDINGYSIPPGQSVVLYTNEAIAFSHKYSGIILSRVAYYSSGIMVQASYVDSKWRGIVKLCLTNLSNKKFNIKLGDDIARLLVFETIGADDSIDNLTETTYHYNTGWNVILDGPEVDPFHRIQLNGFSLLDRAFVYCKGNYDKIVGIGLIALILTLFTAGWPIAKEIAQFLDLKEQFYKQKVEIENLKVTQNSLSQKIPIFGESELSNTGNNTLTDIVVLPNSVNKPPSFYLVKVNGISDEKLIETYFFYQNGNFVMKVCCKLNANNINVNKYTYKWIIVL